MTNDVLDSALFSVLKSWLLTHAKSFEDAQRLLEKDVFLVDELLWTQCLTADQATRMKQILPELKKALSPVVKRAFND